MKAKFLSLVNNLFFLAMVLITLGGVIVFLFNLYGTVVAGEVGGSAISSAMTKIVPIYEWIMGGAVTLGIISLYIGKNHAYRLEKKKKNDNKQNS